MCVVRRVFIRFMANLCRYVLVRSSKNCLRTQCFMSTWRGIGQSFQLAIISTRMDLIGYDIATAQSWRFRRLPPVYLWCGRPSNRTRISVYSTRPLTIDRKPDTPPAGHRLAVSGAVCWQSAFRATRPLTTNALSSNDIYRYGFVFIHLERPSSSPS